MALRSRWRSKVASATRRRSSSSWSRSDLIRTRDGSGSAATRSRSTTSRSCSGAVSARREWTDSLPSSPTSAAPDPPGESDPEVQAVRQDPRQARAADELRLALDVVRDAADPGALLLRIVHAVGGARILVPRLADAADVDQRTPSLGEID